MNKFSRKIYDKLLAEFNRDQNFKWLNYIKEIVISVGKPGLFNQNFIHNPKTTKDKIVNRLNDLYIQEWIANIRSSSTGRNYSIFKRNLNLESYIWTLPQCVFTSRQVLNLHLQIIRWNRLMAWCPYNERKCILCNQNDLGDDSHHLLKCSFFETERRELLRPRYYCRPYIIEPRDVMRKAVLTICELHRRRSACESAQSVQYLCCSLPR